MEVEGATKIMDFAHSVPQEPCMCAILLFNQVAVTRPGQLLLMRYFFLVLKLILIIMPFKSSTMAVDFNRLY